jgi:hypothetical protein
MEKYKLLQVVRKTAKRFGNTTPTRVYDTLREDSSYAYLFKVFKPNDIILYSLLVPYNNNGEDIDEIYDRIEMNLFSVELAEVYDSTPEVDCPTCNGRNLVSCDHCNGSGEVECDRCDGVGEVECDMCDGLGIDEEGDQCDHCDGDGKQTCTHCRGNGDVSCDYCGGDGEEYCEDCDNGKVISEDESLILFEDFVSWSPKWKDYFFRGGKDEILDSEDIINFRNNKQTILINYDEQLSEDYEGYENGDTLLFRTRLKNELNFVKDENRLKIV